MPDNIVRAVLKNTAAQVLGRGIIAASKYVAFVVLFRVLGVERFGEYSLLLTILVFGEVLLDFGLNEVFVRELCQHPERRRQLLSLLTYSRFLQAGIAYLALAGLLFALRYPVHMVMAGLIGGIQFVFLGAAQVYRALFKATLRMERDALADILSSGLYVALLVYAALQSAGLEVLFALLVLSRLVYLLLAYLMGRNDFDVLHIRWDGPALRAAYWQALPFGLCMLMGTLFSSQDMLMLYGLDVRPEYAVGLYSAAYRFVMPLVLVSTAFMAALYPIFSSYWGSRMEDLAHLHQQGMESVGVISGAIFCLVYSSAEFLMGLFGDDAAAGVPVLRLLSWSIVLMGLGSMVGPMFVIAGRLWLAFALATVGVVVNGLLNLFLIPGYSYMGASIATLATEVCVFVPGLIIVQRAMGYRVKWSTLGKTALVCAASLLFTAVTPVWGTFPGGVLAVGLYTAGVLVTGAVRPAQLKALAASVRPEG